MNKTILISLGIGAACIAGSVFGYDPSYYANKCGVDDPDACLKACDFNVASSCTFLGLQYEKGNGVKQDYQKANELYQKGCDLDDGGSCRNLGISYETGKGVKQDHQKANKLFQKGCDLGNGPSCGILGGQYENGTGLRQDYQKAKLYYGKACDLGEQTGCDEYKRLNH